MDKETANNAIKLLDRVEIKGHKERMVMNQVVDALLQHMKPKQDS